MKLIAVDTTPHGDISIPVLDTMTNQDMAEAIELSFKPRFDIGVDKCTALVRKYVRGLRNAPEELFIDPCYDRCEEQQFYCSFNF